MRTWERLKLSVDSDLLLGELPDRLARSYGDRVLACDSENTVWTANDVDEITAEVAGRLSERIAPGDRVVVNLPNGYAFFLGCLAVLRAGGVAVPVNDKTTTAELRHIVATSEASLQLVSLDPEGLRSIDAGVTSRASRTASRSRSRASTRDLLAVDGRSESEAPGEPSSTAAIFFTSGTTGLPKGAELSHAGLLGGTRRLAVLPTGLRDDEMAAALPVAHIMGFAAYLGAALAGLRLYVHQRFDAVQVLDDLERRKSSIFIGVPTMYRMLDEAGASARNLRSVRIWMSGADAMPPELVRKFQSFGASVTLPGVGLSLGEASFVEGYGMVELSGGAAVKFTPPYAGRLLSKPIGLPLPANELRVVDADGRQVRLGEIGELLVRGPGVLRRYRNDDAATSEAVTEDGWLRTGDLARRQLFGAVEFAGRAKDVIKAGGYSVFAAEVAAVLESFEGVAEASVVGLPDTRMGEVVAAALRTKPGVKDLDLAALESFARGRLAGYKVPRRWLVVSSLPRTGSDKVRREAVRALFRDPADTANGRVT